MMIWVVDFPFCNFYSLERFLRTLNLPFSTLSAESPLSPDDLIIMPGVGTFGQGMSYLRSLKLDLIIYRHASSGGRLIGICLGMQLLLQFSDESPGIIGLGLIEGTSKLIESSPSFFVPHIGWNDVLFSSSLGVKFTPYMSSSTRLSRSDYYFVHSYHSVPSNSNHIVMSFCHPSGPLAAALASDNIFGFQFHPEKSGSAGYQILSFVIRQ